MDMHLLGQPLHSALPCDPIEMTISIHCHTDTCVAELSRYVFHILVVVDQHARVPVPQAVKRSSRVEPRSPIRGYEDFVSSSYSGSTAGPCHCGT